MIEIILAIATWCQTDLNPKTCKQELVACVTKDLKPGDWDSKVYLTRKLVDCLTKGK